MITMVMYGKIRRMYFRERRSISELVRRTSLSWNTVKKWLREPSGSEPKYQRVEQRRKLTRAADGSAVVGGAAWRGLRRWLLTIDGVGAAVSTAAFVPLKFGLGEAFQFDWSDEQLLIGGMLRRVQLSHLKLCASRAFFLSAYPTQGHEMLFDAHPRACMALSGVPRRGLYDNMKTAVDKVKKGKGRVVNARFSVWCAHYLFAADFCNVAAGWEKGVVEKNVQDSRRRVWQGASAVR